MSRKVVLLGMMTKIPVAGVVWQTAHYLLGLQRLGFEVYYVEAHARSPSMLMASPSDDGSALAAAYIDRVMRRFDLGGRWAYQALHGDGRTIGMEPGRLLRLFDEAELVINLHGGTAPREEHSRTGRLVYVETDPVQLQVELAAEEPATIEFLEQHCAFFTFGENWGAADCGLPQTDRFDFRPTRQPVCLDLWPVRGETPAPRFTTIGNWRQDWRDVTFEGRVLSWSKHQEWEKFLDIPARTGRRFELALAAFRDVDRRLLQGAGWEVRDAAALSWDVDRYRGYVGSSFAEFSVAKEQNVLLRSGWFSDRSATYLASGRPVVTQETGFSNVLPRGPGLHGFSTSDEAVAAVEAVCADYPAARRHAREVAREWFASEVVLGKMLEAVGVRGTPPSKPGLRLTPVSRRPLVLDESTRASVARSPVPFGPSLAAGEDASVVVVSFDDLAVTRLCVESVLENTEGPGYELIVVDNGSRDGSRAYLRTLERRFPNVRVILNEANAGFPAACNQALAAARGSLLVLLNNDVIVPTGWLARLGAHARRDDVGLVGPVTNRIGNEAEVPVAYDTYAEFLAAAAERAEARGAESFDIPMPAMFCVAMRREVHDRLGPLDERFGIGMLEDDDYAERTRQAGLRAVCAEDVLVHHFGEASFGRLFADGKHSALLEANRAAYEKKWGRAWEPYERRPSPEYEHVRARVRDLVCAHAAPQAPVIVTSRGDDALLKLDDRDAWHFPQTPEGLWAGHHPASSEEAIEQLERLRERGARYFVLPRTSFWWLDHYAGLDRHLRERYRNVVSDDACRIFDLKGET